MAKSIDAMSLDELRAYARQLEARLAVYERPHYVYFLHDADARIIKMGHSADVSARLRALRRQTGRALRVLGIMPGDKTHKRQIAARFQHLRTAEAEWYHAAPDLLTYIEAHCEPYEEK